MPAICMPAAIPIPGASGPPDWEHPAGGTPATILNQRLDDARWHGAGGTGWGAPAIGPGGVSPLGNSSGLPVVFRAVSHDTGAAKNLYLLWWVRADTGHDAGDRLIVGFGTQTVPLAFTIDPFGSTPPAGSALPVQVPLSRINAFERVGGAWQGPLGAKPAWLSSVWAWATAGKEWAVAMRVPISGAGATPATRLDLPSPFRFWWELQVISGGTIAYGPRWPTTAPDFATAAAGNPAVDWGDAHIGTDASCAGLSIEWNDIGSANPGGEHLIDINAANTLHVNPANSAAAVPANQLLARFHIANWGSSVNWLAITPDGAAVPDVPDTNGVPAGTVATPAHGNVAFPWTVPASLRQAFIDGTRDRHQCMLVVLTGAGATFVRDSAYRNMRFEGASTFTEDAEVSVEGMPPIGGGRRRTYLMVGMTNMPLQIEPRDNGGEPGDGEPGDGGELPDINVARFRLAASRPAPDPDEAFRRLPTYVVHVFHDTGRTLTVGGRQLRVVEPAPNFGYVIDHQGALYGWDHRLSGAGLRRIAENLWEAVIPDGGHIKVTTRIEARERPWTWWELLLRRLRLWLAKVWWWLRALIRRLLGR